ncbi:MAG TPA: FAD/NAD(P)-binding oxidoreductase [Candidatus Eisenbacteria bacterium]|jgi:sulfide:quinone oxidoreductase
MSTTVILGGGFGGLACARALRSRAPDDHRIVVVDRSSDFLVGAAKTWVMLGEREPEQITRPRAALLPPGVTLSRAEVGRVDAASRRVETSAGPLKADHLVLALGAQLDMGAVPGLAEAAHSFYTLEDAVRLRSALEAFRGGRLILLVARTPFQCPPAPYEAALLIHAALLRRGLRANTTLEVWTVEKAPMPTAGPKMGERIVDELVARDIGFHALQKVQGVDSTRRRIRFESGEVDYDLLIAIPPHRAPQVVVEAGLADAAGWVPVDSTTLEIRANAAASQVYAIGDLAGVPLPGRYDPSLPLVLPKAGVFAAAQGEVVAARLAAALRGEAAAATFDGRGFCYIEVGEKQAMRGDGSFFELPHPVMRAQLPDQAQYRDKVEWVTGWLSAPG